MKIDGIQRLWFVRHAESTGNVARDAAETGGADRIAVAERDADVPLSTLGHLQAVAVAEWFAALPAARRPTRIVSSPYRRTRDTAAAVAAACGLAVHTDERLRDRELGVLDRLTRRGVAARHPDEHARKRHLGQFYYRPPGGESWADVTFRLRDGLRDLDRENPGARLLVITHEVPILLARYLFEDLSEPDLIALRNECHMPNGSMTEWERDGDHLALATFNRAITGTCRDRHA